MQELRAMLELIDRPAFCADDEIVCAVNTAASARQFTIGMPLESMLGDDAAAYRDFTAGCLYLSLDCAGETYGACVTSLGDRRVFTLDAPEYDTELRLLTLAAQELREPLGNAMALVEELKADSEAQARIDRSLHQMLRMIGNMSALPVPRMELLEINALLREFWEKTRPVCESRNTPFTFSPAPKSIYTCADEDLLTRAMHNLLSNALKFTPSGGRIHLSAAIRGSSYHITMANTTDNQNIVNPFHRFLREPGAGDGRSGLGLGMKVVRSATMTHGGSVLMDAPDARTTRIRLTMPIRQNTAGLRSSCYRISYSGERDPMLIELSDVLPPEYYQK